MAFSTPRGRAVQAVTLAGMGDDVVLVDGSSGDPATVQVALADGSTFHLDEELPLVGIQVWRWGQSLVIAGTDCPNFTPAAAAGTPLEDCGGDDLSVLTFGLDHHELAVVARAVPGEWAAGPLVHDTLLLNGGNAELDLRTGEVVPSEPYPTIGIPCATADELLVVGVDQGDLQEPDKPISWTVGGFQRLEDGWTAIDTGDVPDLLRGARAAGIAGCTTGGPLLWTFADGRASTYVLGLENDALVAQSFVEPTTMAGPPTAVLDASGTWLALTPLVPGDGDEDHTALLSDGTRWSTFRWTGEPLRPATFALQNGSIAYVQGSDGGGWTLEEGALQ